MAATPHVILGFHITDRVQEVPNLQKLLTEFGSSIRTRIGLHDVHQDYSSPSGMILLELAGPSGDQARLEKRLKAIPGIQVQKMVFQH